MIDMGQAEQSLRRKPGSDTVRPSWTVALKRAAKELGYDHYLDVPEPLDEQLRNKAYEIVGIANI